MDQRHYEKPKLRPGSTWMKGRKAKKDHVLGRDENVLIKKKDEDFQPTEAYIKSFQGDNGRHGRHLDFVCLSGCGTLSFRLAHGRRQLI